MMKKSKHWLWTVMILLLVALLGAGCSGDSGGPNDTDDGGVAGTPAKITLWVSNTTLASNSTVTLTATVKDKKGKPVADGTTVHLNESGEGDVTIEPSSFQNTIDGVATFILSAYGESWAAGLVHIVADCEGVLATVDITVVNTAPQVTVTAEETEVVVGSVTTITATVTDSNGVPVADGTYVSFELVGTDSWAVGSLSDTWDVQTSNGIATTFFTAEGDGTVEIVATCGAGTGRLTMTVGEGNVPTPTTPASITLSASSTAVGAGGQSTITAIVRDSSGLAVSDGNPVSFTTSSGTISPTTAVTVGGRVTTTFTGGNTYGQATITATSGTATATLVINVTADVGYLTIATSQTSVKTNNQDSATITATALDENRAAMVGVPVTFSASAGQISAATVLTDENGQAAIEFTSGAYDKTNQTVTITATAPPNLTATIPVQLNGTKILLTINSTALQGLPVPSSATLTVTVQDAGGVGIFGAQVVINQSSTGSASVLLKMAGTAGTGTATLTGTTDVNGKFTVTVTGNNPGPEPVTLAVTSLGAEATQNVTVSGQAFEFLSKSNTVAGPNNVFAFNDLNPDTITRADVGGSFVTDGFAAGNVIYVTGAANPANNGVFDVTTVTATTLTLAATVALTNEPAGAVVTITKLVSADTTIGANTSSTVDLWVRSPGGNNVKISTSAGSLTSLTAVSGNNSTVLTASPDPVTNVVAFTLATPAFPCVAILNAEDATDSSINDSLQVAIAAPSSGALNVTIQALPTVIAPSSGTVSSVSNLSIKVTNAANQVVSGAPVRLTLVNTTGSGEYINPALIYSDAFGQASATFYAGSLPSDSNGVLCVAKLLDANNAAPWVPAETRPQANCFAFTSLGKTITRAFGDFAADGFAVGDRILVTGSQFNDWVYKIGVVAPATLTLVDDVQIKGDQLTDEGLSANFINIEKVDAAQVVVGGSASSVSIGGPTKLEEYNLSTYKSAMSVLVSDSNGNPVAGATVNLSVWPLGYYTGWIDGGWQLCCFNYYPNEDINRNEVLDPGEDVGLFPGQNNGVLDPAKATAGTVPAFVVTDEYGVAEFNFVQQKLYSCWTKVEVRASVVVYGTEAIGILRYGPGYMVVDEDSLDPSPWDSNCLDPFLVPWPCP